MTTNDNTSYLTGMYIKDNTYRKYNVFLNKDKIAIIYAISLGNALEEAVKSYGLECDVVLSNDHS